MTMQSLGNMVAEAVGNIDLRGVKVPTSITNFSVDTLLGNQPRGLSNFIAEIR